MVRFVGIETVVDAMVEFGDDPQIQAKVVQSLSVASSSLLEHGLA